MTTAIGSRKIATNNRKGSQHCVQVEPIRFATIWDHYPGSDPCDAKDPKGGKRFKNQCAIRISYALKKSGVTFKSFPKSRKCWYHQDADHILAAKELADWLELQPFLGCRKSENITGESWRDKALGQTGIICFEDYYADADAGGDHIDLWNKDKMTGLGSGLRTRFGIVVPFGLWSDLRKAKRIRFFPID
jgi:hypothetical protein